MIKAYENQQKVIFEGVGEYDIPEIEATNYEECDFISFNYAAGCKSRADKGCHFFIDDYQFQRLWSQPDRHMDMLGDFRYVMSPDFSTYTDFPQALGRCIHAASWHRCDTDDQLEHAGLFRVVL